MARPIRPHTGHWLRDTPSRVDSVEGARGEFAQLSLGFLRASRAREMSHLVTHIQGATIT